MVSELPRFVLTPEDKRIVERMLSVSVIAVSFDGAVGWHRPHRHPNQGGHTVTNVIDFRDGIPTLVINFRPGHSWARQLHGENNQALPEGITLVFDDGTEWLATQ